MTLSDRIAVMYEGEIAGIVAADDANIKDIGLLMGGGAKASAHWLRSGQEGKS